MSMAEADTETKGIIFGPWPITDAESVHDIRHAIGAALAAEGISGDPEANIEIMASEFGQNQLRHTPEGTVRRMRVRIIGGRATVEAFDSDLSIYNNDHVTDQRAADDLLAEQGRGLNMGNVLSPEGVTLERETWEVDGKPLDGKVYAYHQPLDPGSVIVPSSTDSLQEA